MYIILNTYCLQPISLQCVDLGFSNMIQLPWSAHEQTIVKKIHIYWIHWINIEFLKYKSPKSSVQCMVPLFSNMIITGYSTCTSTVICMSAVMISQSWFSCQKIHRSISQILFWVNSFTSFGRSWWAKYHCQWIMFEQPISLHFTETACIGNIVKSLSRCFQLIAKMFLWFTHKL